MERKAIFENSAAGLESERLQLERECTTYQTDAMREESRYHMLNCMIQVGCVNEEKIRLEDKFCRGDGELLPQFRSFQDLYNSKIQQQQSLSQELRKHQNSLRDNSPQDIMQRALFENLARILEHKAQICRAGVGPVNGGALGEGAKESTATFDAYGGTNIMTLGD